MSPDRRGPNIVLPDKFLDKSDVGVTPLKMCRVVKVPKKKIQ